MAAAPADSPKWAPYVHSLTHGVAKLTLGSADTGKLQHRPGIATSGSSAIAPRATSSKQRSRSTEPRVRHNAASKGASAAGRLVRSSSAQSNIARSTNTIERSGKDRSAHAEQLLTSLSVGNTDIVPAPTAALHKCSKAGSSASTVIANDRPATAAAVPSTHASVADNLRTLTHQNRMHSAAVPDAYQRTMAASPLMRTDAPHDATHSPDAPAHATVIQAQGGAAGTALHTSKHDVSAATAEHARSEHAVTSGSHPSAGRPSGSARQSTEQLRRLYAHWSAAMQQHAGHAQGQSVPANGPAAASRPILSMRTQSDGSAVLHARQSAAQASGQAPECFWLDRLELSSCPTLEVRMFRGASCLCSV